MKVGFRRALAVAVTATLAMPLLTHAHGRGRIHPPRVPGDLEVPAGQRPFLEGHAVGTQNYACLPSATAASGFAWTLFTPQATLFTDDARQLTTHFFSPNPFEVETFRPTWEHSRDTSTVWAELVGVPSTDPAFVKPGAIAWLLLHVVQSQDGPTGGRTLTAAKYIHRVNTSGGKAPATGCSALADVGKKAVVPYTADYIFYTNGRNVEDDD